MNVTAVDLSPRSCGSCGERKPPKHGVSGGSLRNVSRSTPPLSTFHGILFPHSHHISSLILALNSDVLLRLSLVSHVDRSHSPWTAIVRNSFRLPLDATTSTQKLDSVTTSLLTNGHSPVNSHSLSPLSHSAFRFFAFHHGLLCCEEEVLHWRLCTCPMRGFPAAQKPDIKRWWIHLEDANHPHRHG